jgi:hypothetical protein
MPRIFVPRAVARVDAGQAGPCTRVRLTQVSNRVRRRSDDAATGIGPEGAPMQFRLDILKPVEDLRRLEDALLAMDPAALIDIDSAGVTLRIASILGADELCRLVTDAGYPVEHNQLVGVRSECCGGCGG